MSKELVNPSRPHSTAIQNALIAADGPAGDLLERDSLREAALVEIARTVTGIQELEDAVVVNALSEIPFNTLLDELMRRLGLDTEMATLDELMDGLITPPDTVFEFLNSEQQSRQIPADDQIVINYHGTNLGYEQFVADHPELTVIKADY